MPGQTNFRPITEAFQRLNLLHFQLQFAIFDLVSKTLTKAAEVIYSTLQITIMQL